MGVKLEIYEMFSEMRSSVSFHPVLFLKWTIRYGFSDPLY